MERATTPGASSGAVIAAPTGAATPTLPVEYSKWQDFTAEVQEFATKQMKQVREICAPNAPCLGTTWPGHNCAIHSPPSTFPMAGHDLADRGQVLKVPGDALHRLSRQGEGIPQ